MFQDYHIIHFLAHKFYNYDIDNHQDDIIYHYNHPLTLGRKPFGLDLPNKELHKIFQMDHIEISLLFLLNY